MFYLWATTRDLRAAGANRSTKDQKWGYATNADHGAGCNIHPPPKQYCGYRLGNSALKIVYGLPEEWQSPNMTAQTFASSPPSAAITVDSVSVAGLSADTVPFNLGQVNCSLHPEADCAWASLKLADGTWTNATIAVSTDKKGLIFTVPDAESLSAAARAGPPTASAYGWGANPMMTVYDIGTDLPLLPWNSSFVPY